ncbi:MAG TPA: S8 family serine peptidase [Anaerolineae bacterium]|nr:S8 family serine peptidase [Anaerolineae bacterium]
MNKKKTLIIVGLCALVLVGALVAWWTIGRNRQGEPATDTGLQPSAPLPTILGTPTPENPGADGEDSQPDAAPTPLLRGTLPALGDLTLQPPPSFEELLARYPELEELVQNVDLSSAEEAQLQTLYGHLLTLYEKEGLEGLQEFMVGSGLLEALNLDPTYLDFVLAYETGGPEAAEVLARERQLVTENDELRIILILDTEDSTAVEAELKTLLGARMLQKSGYELEVGIPLETLKALGSSQQALIQIVKMENLEHVIGVRAPEIFLPNMSPTSREGPKVTGVAAWHAQGITGSGIRVGIVDPEFGGFLDLAGDTLPPQSAIVTFQPAETLNAMYGQHGTACAEIVHAMAPDAQLYLARLDGDFAIGLRKAVDWLLQNDVKVISMSAGSVVGPMDGSGPLADIVNYAVARGVLWVNSAGNSARSHLMVTYTDNNSDGYHDFDTEGSPLLPILTDGGGWIGLNWNDHWGGGASENYDLYLYAANADGSGLELVTSSRSAQSGRATDKPYEDIGFSGLPADKSYYLAIRAVETTYPAQLELIGNLVDFALWMPEGSVTTPGDVERALTVGATYWRTDALEDYSSQGPTLDGRHKPDITAPAGVTVASPDFVPGGFYGTSASAPHVAGAAAVVWSANPEANAAAIRDYLLANALDLGIAGPDMAYGYGRLSLPAVEATQPTDTTPRATLQKVQQKHNVYLAGVKGMYIYATFDIQQFKGRAGTVLVEFFDRVSGKALRDKNGDYALETGEVAVWEGFSPAYETTQYTDFTLFMPYSELELGSGEYQLSFEVTVLDNAGGQILAQSERREFSYRQSAATRALSQITAITVAHNIVREDAAGMSIKVSFDVANLRNREGMIAAYFYFGDDKNRPLRDFNDAYRTDSGYVAVGQYFQPGYDKATYRNMELFIPYSELHMAPGKKYKLKFYVVLWDINTGKELCHSDWQYFWISTE